MQPPSVNVLLVSGYAVVLLLVAWGFDHMGQRSAEKAARWRTGNFVYHSDQDAWRCHQDEWLYPASFDPDKRVIRYAGQHAICGRCPVKDECSPTPGPRELTRAIDPWPHSESGRFHRGISLCIAVIAVFLAGAMLLGAHDAADVVILLSTVIVSLVVVAALARALVRTPANFPQSLPHEASSEAADVPLRQPEATQGSLDHLVDRYATLWASDRRRAPVDLPNPVVRE
jgi:hypothetical protein